MATAAWTILPPGENGSLTFNRNTRDQAGLYDALTPLFGNVTAAHLRRLFKPAPLGAPAPARAKRERPRAGEPLTVAAWAVGAEGRKHAARSALYGADGRLIAKAHCLWIELKPKEG